MGDIEFWLVFFIVNSIKLQLGLIVHVLFTFEVVT
jgi:hypothetical protein